MLCTTEHRQSRQSSQQSTSFRKPGSVRVQAGDARRQVDPAIARRGSALRGLNRTAQARGCMN